MVDEFGKFSEHARRVLVNSQEEARNLGHNQIGTEHILLAIVREDDGIATRALKSLGVTAEKVRSSVEFMIGEGTTRVHGQIALTDRSEKAIELAIDEARRMGSTHIGTEHLLFGIVREGEGIASSVLESLGVRSLDRIRAEILIALKKRGEIQPEELSQDTPP